MGMVAQDAKGCDTRATYHRHIVVLREFFLLVLFHSYLERSYEKAEKRSLVFIFMKMIGTTGIPSSKLFH